MTAPSAADNAAADNLELVNNVDAGQYEILLDGRRVGLASYYERGGSIVIPHTETSPEFGGRGFASKLVRFSLDDIRAQGRTVVPACPFVASYLDKHPEYQDLLAS
jgi:predicted GNAT family acetyltransferase